MSGTATLLILSVLDLQLKLNIVIAKLEEPRPSHIIIDTEIEHRVYNRGEMEFVAVDLTSSSFYFIGSDAPGSPFSSLRTTRKKKEILLSEGKNSTRQDHHEDFRD